MSLKQVLELEPAPGEEPPVKNILDLTGCPYMDSSGLGIIVSHMVHCNKKGNEDDSRGHDAAGARGFSGSPGSNSVVPIAASVEEAEAL